MSFANITDHNVSFDKKALEAERRQPAPPRISRRAILRGTAAAISLPALDSLLRPSRAEAAAAPPIRWVSWHIGCGVWHPNWDVTTFGTDYTLSPSLLPLQAVKGKVLVMRNLSNAPTCNSQGSHGCGPPAMTTCRQGTKPDVTMGISIDQVYAQSLGTATRIQSLQLSVSDRTFSDVMYPAIYNGSTAWADATTPLPPTVNPGQVFDRIFSGVTTTTTPTKDMTAALAQRTALRTSVLDYVQGEAKSLQTKLGTSDRHKLDEYLTSIRSVETEIQRVSSTPNTCSPGSMTRPTITKAATPADVPTLTTMMLDLMALAFQCDATRVINFHQGNGGSSGFQSCPWLGITTDHHRLSHHNNDLARGSQLLKIDLWEVQQYAYFLQKLDAITEGSGTVLDNSLVFLSSEIGDGNAHDQVNKPILIGGSAGGKIVTGRALDMAGGLQANMFITLLNNGLGVPATTFGLLGNKQLAGLTP